MKVKVQDGSEVNLTQKDFLAFDENFSSYDVRVVADVTPAGLNFVTLDSGICVVLTEEESLELFSAAKGSSKARTVTDKALGGDMRFYKRAGKVVFTRGDKLFSLSLK